MPPRCRSAPQSGPRLAARLARAVGIVLVALLALPYGLAVLYRVGHPVSTLMLARWASGARVSRQWVGLDAVAPVMVRTVIAAEDARFCSHHGIDWEALSGAIEDAQDGEVSGGGSTITQQTVKNLFLWPGRSVLRKALELPLSLWLDLVLPKRRILEIYLNLAEWGPNGQFGIEAGARHAFGRGAAGIDAREAALLAAVLPNPVTRSAARPNRVVGRRAALYMARAGQASTACLANGPEKARGRGFQSGLPLGGPIQPG
ncbi:MAG: monofunctional biosynthetic peptidoglycan transglycosylase [Xanthobacteraceae bacterium]|nr:MAG: monofunctional biosynthetic peptidoglycan transglycosylase [Xanthobacteraceae bacterium]